MSASDNTGVRRTERMNFRVTSYQAEMIRSGAAVRGKDITDYVLETVCQQAERDLADRFRFQIGEEQLKAFFKALDEPPQPKPRMKRLLSESSILEKKR